MPSFREGLTLPRYLGLSALRRAQSASYATAMRLRALRGGEVEALAPFDRRIFFQHMPLKGRDGFLFHRDHDALDQLSATIVLSLRQKRIWVEALESRLEWCERNGAATRFVVIPEKHVVYDDRLPRFTTISPRRPVIRCSMPSTSL